MPHQHMEYPHEVVDPNNICSRYGSCITESGEIILNLVIQPRNRSCLRSKGKVLNAGSIEEMARENNSCKCGFCSSLFDRPLLECSVIPSEGINVANLPRNALLNNKYLCVSDRLVEVRNEDKSKGRTIRSRVVMLHTALSAEVFHSKKVPKAFRSINWHTKKLYKIQQPTQWLKILSRRSAKVCLCEINLNI
jgi:hypothetical protein